MRGEYCATGARLRVWVELPPRARRIPVRGDCSGVGMGTTSACAENTPDSSAPCRSSWNYLRVRGEYHFTSGPGVSPRELPPRARRILAVAADPRRHVGTTSACAENTRRWDSTSPRGGNYLRVRGEYTKKPENTSFTVELPPRARRIPPHGPPLNHHMGTTSACAENTTWRAQPRRQTRNYLRVRGEYCSTASSVF